ncbi:MAG: bifunctional DNA primase/polymerase, partial [Acidimicrobiia bacterium]
RHGRLDGRGRRGHVGPQPPLPASPFDRSVPVMVSNHPDPSRAELALPDGGRSLVGPSPARSDARQYVGTSPPPAQTPRPVPAALAYAARDWAVFPLHTILGGTCSCRRACAHPAKHPLTRHGLLDATTDAATIGAWWARWPWAGVAVATGRRSGLVVVDVDPRSGGHESLRRLQSLMGSMPATLTALTGGGGTHLY